MENFEDGEFRALKPNYDRRAQTHHIVTGQNVPQNCIPEFLTGRPNQNKPLIQQFTQPQNMATHISPDNKLTIVEQTPQIRKSDSGNPVNRLAETIADIVSEKWLKTSPALFKPTTTNTFIFDSKYEKFELFKDFRNDKN